MKNREGEGGRNEREGDRKTGNPERERERETN